ncbi:hypothetical protein BDN70DRAFT_901938 [Pholiota conissans]|uniref:FAS1 domain-containing protein n=1 Tax=Pholiota conissans TaxID=109636 RepID=A0A9P5YIU8_9AGAR|nr:hypothetical protein BDN70DRAFT_901938 [Pholiota conissans]
MANNITYPTHLQNPGAIDGKPLRFRITHTVIPPITYINLYTKIESSTSLIVPFFLHLQLFKNDTWSRAIFQLSCIIGHNICTKNAAFECLPKKLQSFLFSPFGEKILKKLLQYHIVPGAVVHTNYVHGDLNATNHFGQGDSKLPNHVEPIFSVNLTLNTLFENHTLLACIIQRKLTFPKFPGRKQAYLVDTRVFVNEHPVIVPDIVSLNRAIHVLDRLLDPREANHRCRHHRHHHGFDEDEAVNLPRLEHRQEHDHRHCEGLADHEWKQKLADEQADCDVHFSRPDHEMLCRKSEDCWHHFEPERESDDWGACSPL